MFKGSQSVALVLALAAVVATPVFGQSTVANKAAAPSSAPAAPAPAVAAASSELKIKVPAVEVQRGTIGSITDLAQQLKVEQLKRDLREAKQTAAAGSTADSASAKVNALPVPSARVSAGVTAVTSQERQPPVVSAIFGMGGRLRARLQDGRELVSGQEAQGWTVNSVTPSTVSFTHCLPAKKSGAKGECVTKLVSPSGV